METSHKVGVMWFGEGWERRYKGVSLIGGVTVRGHPTRNSRLRISENNFTTNLG